MTIIMKSIPSMIFDMYFVEKVVDFCMLMKFCDLVVDRTEEVKKTYKRERKTTRWDLRLLNFSLDRLKKPQ